MAAAADDMAAAVWFGSKKRRDEQVLVFKSRIGVVVVVVVVVVRKLRQREISRAQFTTPCMWIHLLSFELVLSFENSYGPSYMWLVATTQ